MRFELLKELGRGAAGIVYKARDKVTSETVAVKVLYAKCIPRDEPPPAPPIAHRNVCRVYRLHYEHDRFF